MEARKKTIISILGKTGIGFLVAFAVMTQVEPGMGVGFWLFMALVFSTVPVGWGMITRCVGSWIVFDGVMLICGLMLKLILSLLLGWILVPISLAWNISMYFWEKHKATMNVEYIEE